MNKKMKRVLKLNDNELPDDKLALKALVKQLLINYEREGKVRVLITYLHRGKAGCVEGLENESYIQPNLMELQRLLIDAELDKKATGWETIIKLLPPSRF